MAPKPATAGFAPVCRTGVQRSGDCTTIGRCCQHRPRRLGAKGAALPACQVQRTDGETYETGLSKKHETCHAERSEASRVDSFCAKSENPFVPQGVPRSLRSLGMTVLGQPHLLWSIAGGKPPQARHRETNGTKTRQGYTIVTVAVSLALPLAAMTSSG